MNRRSFIKGLALVPCLGFLKPKGDYDKIAAKECDRLSKEAFPELYGRSPVVDALEGTERLNRLRIAEFERRCNPPCVIHDDGRIEMLRL